MKGIHLLDRTPLTVFMLIFILALSGCQEKQPKPPDVNGIKKDIPESWKYLYIDNTVYDMEVTNLEIEKRQTNEKDDTVYFNFELTDKLNTYTVIGQYAFYYVYYDEGGWILEGSRQEGDVEINIVKDGMPDELWATTTQWYIDNAMYWGIVEDPTVYNENNTYTLRYEVNIRDKYRSRTGPLVETYTLENDGWLNYHWKNNSDSSGLVTNWDIVGEWYGEIVSYGEVKPLTIIIDSLNPETNAIHIAKMMRGEQYYDVEDITLYPKEHTSFGDGIGSQDEMLRYSLNGIFGYNGGTLAFDKDTVRKYGVETTYYLERISTEDVGNESPESSHDTASNNSPTAASVNEPAVDTSAVQELSEADVAQIKAVLSFWESNVERKSYAIYETYGLDYDDFIDPGYGTGFYAVKTNPSLDDIKANFRNVATEYLSENYIHDEVIRMTDNFMVEDGKIYYIEGSPYIGLNTEYCQIISVREDSYFVTVPLNYDPVDMSSVEYFVFFWENGRLVMSNET